MIHDASGSSENNVSELTRREELDDPLLHLSQLYVEARADNTSLVQAPVELDNDLAVAVVIDFLEFAYVACRPIGSVCCTRLNETLHEVIRVRVRSLHKEVDLPAT
jgi:hypothetical protein